jgi:RimJ/RimL family protein N-acetyltransferase
MFTNQIAFATPRLNAYFLTEQNQHHVINLYNQQGTAQFIAGVDVMKDIELVHQCYLENKNIGAYLFFCNQTNEFVGFGGVQNQEPLDDGSLALQDKIEFLIMLDAKHNGKGFAQEFSTAFLDLFFANFPQATIPARVNKENIPCLRLLEKLEFIRVGEVAYRHHDNKFHLLRRNL